MAADCPRRVESFERFFYFLFFLHRKYSRSFKKIKVEPLMSHDYFNNVLTTFLCLDRGRTLAVCRDRELSDFIKNILICSENEQRSYRLRVSN